MSMTSATQFRRRCSSTSNQLRAERADRTEEHANCSSADFRPRSEPTSAGFADAPDIIRQQQFKEDGRWQCFPLTLECAERPQLIPQSHISETL
jgi:hypothetical protein